MGIKGIYNLIRKTCPEQIGEVDMRDLAGYKVAVDVSIYYTVRFGVVALNDGSIPL